jgi:ligand-binding sensor protein
MKTLSTVYTTDSNICRPTIPKRNIFSTATHFILFIVDNDRQELLKQNNSADWCVKMSKDPNMQQCYITCTQCMSTFINKKKIQAHS